MVLFSYQFIAFATTNVVIRNFRNIYHKPKTTLRSSSRCQTSLSRTSESRLLQLYVIVTLHRSKNHLIITDTSFNILHTHNSINKPPSVQVDIFILFFLLIVMVDRFFLCIRKNKAIKIANIFCNKYLYNMLWFSIALFGWFITEVQFDKNLIKNNFS